MVLGVIFAALIAQPLKDEGFTLSYPIGSLIVLLSSPPWPRGAGRDPSGPPRLPPRRARVAAIRVTIDTCNPVGDGVEVYAARMFRLSAKSPATGLGVLAALVVVAIGTGLVAALETSPSRSRWGSSIIPGVLLISTVWGLRLGFLHLGAQRARLQLLLPAAGAHADDHAEHDLVALVVFVIVAVAQQHPRRAGPRPRRRGRARREEADRALAELAELARGARPACRPRRSRPRRCAAATS